LWLVLLTVSSKVKSFLTISSLFVYIPFHFYLRQYLHVDERCTPLSILYLGVIKIGFVHRRAVCILPPVG
jgi:hypothetical protein